MSPKKPAPKPAPKPAQTEPFVLSISYRLPCCGLVLQNAVHHAHEPHDTRATAANSAQHLSYWVDVIRAEHDCSLVSPKNPYGRKRRP